MRVRSLSDASMLPQWFGIFFIFLRSRIVQRVLRFTGIVLLVCVGATSLHTQDAAEYVKRGNASLDKGEYDNAIADLTKLYG